MSDRNNDLITNDHLQRREEKSDSVDKSVNFTDLVLSVMPWPFHKDLPLERPAQIIDLDCAQFFGDSSLAMILVWYFCGRESEEDEEEGTGQRKFRKGSLIRWAQAVLDRNSGDNED